MRSTLPRPCVFVSAGFFFLTIAIGCVGSPAAGADWEVLIQDLKSPAKADRVAAIRGLATLGQARSCPQLCRMLTNDSEPEVRLEVANALRLIPGNDPISALGEGLEDEDLHVRLAVVETLRLRPESATLPHLSRALTDPNPAIRLSAVLAMGTKLPADRADLLQPSLQDSNARVREAAIYSLGATGGEKSVAILARLLLGNLPNKSKALAAEMLGVMGTRRDIPELILALPQADKSILRPALDAAILKIISRQDRRDIAEGPAKKEPVRLVEPEPARKNDATAVVTLKNQTTSIEFRLSDPTATEVLLAASFLHGKPQKMIRSRDGNWTLSYNLPPGQYRYLFVVDGKRVPDPQNPSLVRGVSTITVGK